MTAFHIAGLFNGLIVHYQIGKDKLMSESSYSRKLEKKFYGNGGGCAITNPPVHPALENASVNQDPSGISIHHAYFACKPVRQAGINITLARQTSDAREVPARL